MKNEMRPVPFSGLLIEALEEYRENKSLFGVPVFENKYGTKMGPAAGPHTQLAQNIVSGYSSGATVFELKTVQELYGDDLGIAKPCIYVGSEVYNIEWSSEFTASDAAAEYIKAGILIQLLAKEFGLTEFSDIQFVMSVGYDLKGIQGQVVDSFIESMKDASSTEEWKNDIAYLKENLSLFEKVTEADIKQLDSKLCDTVTLSTMHGCPAEDIELIGKYLILEKNLNTYIKMNPTLLGKAEIQQILSTKGYDITLPEEMFKVDINIEQAIKIIDECQAVAEAKGLLFGIKLTNTLPTVITGGELAGNQMYMSGPGLYAISINTAKLLASKYDGNIRLSYSGGIDDKNIKEVLETGISPITVSSFLLKPAGYKNLNKLIVNTIIPETIDMVKLSALAKDAIENESYNRTEPRKYKTQENYSEYCSVCHNCEDICPNRANRRIKSGDKEVVIHLNNLCNECGACAFSCVMGHVPYKEKANEVEE